MAQTCRVPFGEVTNDRLQQLSSLKNRQNGIVQAAQTAKPTLSASTGKRSYDMLEFDAENVDPVLTAAASKKTKSEFVKPSIFAPMLNTPIKPTSLPTLSTRLPQSDRSRPPVSRTPAGRSPKRQVRSLFTKSFKRIDPPFASSSASSALPFSLDAALSSAVATTPARASVPAKWQFAIYEDSPEEEAATVMEHSTLTLDLSSDDEANVARKADRGKENTPPEGYVPPASSNRSSRHISKPVEATSIITDQDEVTAASTVSREPLVELPETDVPSVEESPAEGPSAERDEITTTLLQEPKARIATISPVSDVPLDISSPPSATPLPVELPTATEQRTEDIVIFEDETAACANA